MSDFFDFNTAEAQSDFSELIPDNTVAVVVAKLRPGKAGPDGWLTTNRDGNLLMADFEFTIEGGPHNKRKFWGNYIVEVKGGATEGQLKAVEISRQALRGMIESARAIRPGDDSPEAIQGRKVSSWGDFNGLRFCAKIGIEEGERKPGTDSKYDDKNRLKAAVTIDSRNYIAPGASAPQGYMGAAANQANPPQAQAGAAISKPSWAG